MTEVEKYLFNAMVDQANSLSKFVSAVGKNEMRKRSVILDEVNYLRDKTKEFSAILKRKSSSPSSAQSARAMSPLKKPLQEIVTVLDSIETGVNNGELNLTKFRDLVKTHLLPIKTRLVKIARGYFPSETTEEELREKIKHVSQTMGHKDALAILKNANNGAQKAAEAPNPEAGVSKESAQKVQKYMRYKNKLPSSLRGKLFQVVQMPVVPHTTSDFHILTPKFLRRTGIAFDTVEDAFVVLENQVLLAFDITKTEEPDTVSAKPKRKGKESSEDFRLFSEQGLKARKRNAKNQITHEAFVIDVVERINEASDEQYVLISSHFEFAPGTRKVAFAWLMPRRIHAMFERNANLAKLSWGFPWSHEANSVL